MIIIIQCEIDICIIDNKPIDQSPVYDIILRELGEELAKRWTDTVVVPPDEDG